MDLGGGALFCTAAYLTAWLQTAKLPVVFAHSESVATDKAVQRALATQYNAETLTDRVWTTDVMNTMRLARWQDAPLSNPNLTLWKIEQVLKGVPSLFKTYWPSIFWLRSLQLVPFMINGILTKKKARRSAEWAYEDAVLEDGETVKIAYAGSSGDVPTPSEEPCVVLIMNHGAGGRESDLPGQQYVGRAIAKGWKVIALVRRGHIGKLTRPKFNFFGNTDETRFLLDTYVKKRFPNSTLLFMGISAGSGLVARYMGEQGILLKKAHASNVNTEAQYSDFKSQIPGYVSGAIGVAPGYNIETCMGRFQEPFQSILLWAQKKLYLSKNKALLLEAFPEDYERLMAATNIQEWNDNTYRFAGFSSKDDYYDNMNPMRVAHHAVDPCLFINAKDDPICLMENVYEHLNIFEEPCCVAVVETATGTHCPFAPLSWNPFTSQAWTEDVMEQFFDGVLALDDKGRGGGRGGHGQVDDKLK
jgi:uncharacterized protein